MARFTSGGGDGSGAPGPQGPAGQDAVLPQDLGTTDNPEFSTIILTSNGATNNITIGDDVILGDGNVANHVVIIGQQDDTAGGIVLGTNETEFISTNGTDLSLTADNDIVLYPGSNYAYLNVIDPDHRLATMADIQSTNTGDITFDGIQIIGAGTASGDGSNLGTIELVPDGTITSDQYLIIDPTAPNHIHIRAGGQQDNSSAQVYLGGERNNIEVSDPYRTVKVNTKPDVVENIYANSNEASNTEFLHASGADIIVGDTVRLYTGGPTYIVTAVTQDSPSVGFMTIVADGLSFITGEAYVFTRDQGYNNQWTFGNDGTLYGPTEPGWLQVSGIYGEDGTNTNIMSQENLILSAGENQGVYINDANDGGNEVATIGDLEQAIETGPSEVSFTVNGGTLGTQPTFTGAPLFSGTYVKTGPLVHFQIQVDMDNITDFGTGQFYVDLPFPAKYGYQVKEGCLHDDSTGNQYAIGGHVFAGQSTLALTFTNSSGQDEAFDHNSPVTLAVADNFHISGTYISA